MNRPDLPLTLGLLGGSFDPPHIGHLAIARAAFETGVISKVLFVPCFSHAFDKQMTSLDVRIAMLELACSECGFPYEISDVEKDLGVPSRTFRTVSALRQIYPGVQLRLIVGSDILAESGKWHRWSELVALAPPLVASRPGYAGGSLGGMPAVSSSEVRQRLREGLPVGHLVHPLVEQFIHRRRLYIEQP